MNNIREYNINEVKIINTFNIKSPGLTHNQGNRFKLLPYVTNDKNLVSNFKGVVGEFSRCISNKELTEEFDFNEFLDNVVQQIGEFEGDNSLEVFKDIIKTMFIDKDSLVDFDITTMNYITATKAEEKIARFLYSIFFDDQLLELVLKKYDKDKYNILYQLVIKALPELQEKDYSVANYKNYLLFIKELFIKDFQFLIRDEELYKHSLERLLEYYYMFYISQLAMKLNKFEEADMNGPEPLYYTLNWEQTSKNRRAYKFGWELLKIDVNTLFSHAITLEFLNHHSLDEQLGYVELFNLFSVLDEGEALDQVEKIYDLYTTNIIDTDWNNFKSSNYNSGNLAFDTIHQLFEAIEYQFKGSSRSRPREGFKNWYEKFVYKRFGKRRGPLGYSLNLYEEDIILITKICIGNSGKLKLSILFEEFKKRGILFDNDSKSKIIELYEKLNLLEKKSDSGDAQYVRSIL